VVHKLSSSHKLRLGLRPSIIQSCSQDASWPMQRSEPDFFEKAETLMVRRMQCGVRVAVDLTSLYHTSYYLSKVLSHRRCNKASNGGRGQELC